MNNGFLCALLLLLSWGALTEASAQHPSLPSFVIPDGLGVNIHFTDPQPGEMKMLADGGFRWVRMDFAWEATEVERGQYDFRAYDRLMAALKPHKIRPLFILDYVHRLYDNAQSPHSEEARQAMARWAAAAVKHFQGNGILWEMYNEPNIYPFWRPTPNVDDYVKLALAVGKAIRDAAPGEMYIGPATSGMDFRFLEACFRGGLLEYWDAVSVHPYRSLPPETAVPDYRRLRLLIDRYAPKGKRIPILSGEWGYSSVWGGMDEEKQGKMLARQWLTNLSNDVRLSIWYDWHDDGPDPREPEHHFGTVKHPHHASRDPVYDPKPAYLAAKTLTSSLRGFRFNKRLHVGDDRDHVLVFTKGKSVRLAAWTTSPTPRTIIIPSRSGVFRVLSHLGQEEGQEEPALTASTSGLSLTLTDAPLYLAPEKPDEMLQLIAAWERVPLEIIVEDYEKLERRGEGGAVVPVRLSLRNPLPRTIRVEMGAQKASVKPGAKITLTASVSVMRSSEPTPLTIRWVIPGMGEMVQKTQVVVHNPLLVTALPRAGNMLPVRVENPAGTPFRGTVSLTEMKGISCGDPNAAIEFRRGETETIARFILDAPGEASYRFGVRIRDRRGATVLRVPPAEYRPVDDFSRCSPGRQPDDYQVLPDGDAKVGSEQSLIAAAPPDGPSAFASGALKIDYRFDAGWKFLRVVAQAEALRKIAGEPTAVGMWIYGDGTGNIPRLRFVDSTGQTFQPDGPAITWRGWRYVLFPMDASGGGHWGGAGDGVIHYPIQWDSIFLLDSAGGRQTQGSVYIGAPTLIYSLK